MSYRSLMAPAMLLMLAPYPAQSAETPSLPQPLEPIAFGCTGCHGMSGEGFDSFPKISGKPEADFIRRMQDFRAGKRQSTVMDRIARGYSDEDFAILAKYFSHR